MTYTLGTVQLNKPINKYVIHCYPLVSFLFEVISNFRNTDLGNKTDNLNETSSPWPIPALTNAFLNYLYIISSVMAGRGDVYLMEILNHEEDLVFPTYTAFYLCKK
jgi:hypothetical protein